MTKRGNHLRKHLPKIEIDGQVYNTNRGARVQYDFNDKHERARSGELSWSKSRLNLPTRVLKKIKRGL